MSSQGTAFFIKKVLLWEKKQSAELSSVLSEVVDLHHYLVVALKRLTDQD